MYQTRGVRLFNKLSTDIKLIENSSKYNLMLNKSRSIHAIILLMMSLSIIIINVTLYVVIVVNIIIKPVNYDLN